MNQKVISILLVLSLITCGFIPPVSAEPIAVVSAIPATPALAKLVIDGFTVIVSGAAVMEIAAHFGKRWNGAQEHWDNFEARLHDGEIEINPMRLNEEQALHTMSCGKNIIAMNRDSACNIVGRYTRTDPLDVVIESAHKTRPGFYKHIHYYVKETRLHCWIFEKL